MTENLKSLTGEVADALQKNVVGTGEIIRITLGNASDFMTEEQVIARKVTPSMKFIEMEIIETETKTIFTKTFRFYEGSIPANSVQGELIATYGELSENSEVNVVTKEVGKPGNEFVVWDVITG